MSVGATPPSGRETGTKGCLCTALPSRRGSASHGHGEPHYVILRVMHRLGTQITVTKPNNVIVQTVPQPCPVDPVPGAITVT
ncbi:hypothetical protein CROQUDRAFT_89166 [Cronartium quercuum f. sp. fusiforme G11]|uniref:Uncharacterized protein n=1 Tax=Cronartium quercuum f. sp. fusiforme G11 TaxID=708437 RepID=A0A9P6NSC4_9BASI|nr:hypothetical protein CROQUDRAFT_89166 [Cronartium quercuum f. sp. fusiforme G11]